MANAVLPSDMNVDALNFDMDRMARTPDPSLGIFNAALAASDYNRYILQGAGYARMFYEAELHRANIVREAGFTPPTPMNNEVNASYSPDYDPYTEFRDSLTDMYGFQSTFSDESRAQFVKAKRFEAANAKNNEWRKLLKEHPELAKLGVTDNLGLHEKVMARGRAIVEEANKPRTIGGSIGGLAGDVWGSLYDPWNVAAMAIPAGVGSTLATRLGGQFALGAGLDAFQMWNGGLSNRRVFGVDPDGWDIGSEIVFSGLAPAGLQLGGEAIGAGLRALGRAGRAVPPPPGREGVPSPETPPAGSLGPVQGPPQQVPARQFSAPQLRGVDVVLARFDDNPLLKARAAADIDHVDSWVNRTGNSPWDAPLPPMGEVGGTGSLRTRLMRGAAQAGERVDVSRITPETVAAAVDIQGVYATAKQLDPGPFKQLEELSAQLAAVRQRAKSDVAISHERLTGKRDEMDRRLAAENAVLMDPKASNKRKMEAARNTLSLMRQKGGAAVGTTIFGSPTIAKDRQLVAKIAALRPVLERAMARAQGVWQVSKAQRDAIDAGVKSGELDVALKRMQKVSVTPKTTPYTTQLEPTLTYPGLAPGVNEMPVDAALRVITMANKALDTETEAFVPQTTALLKGLDDKKPIEIAGLERPVYATDMIPLTDEEGKLVTVRQALEDLEADKEMLGAISSCQASILTRA